MLAFCIGCSVLWEVCLLLPILNIFGIDMVNIIYLPILGDIFIEFTYATYFIHPMLVIIMYMGALNPKIPAVGKLMLIRKELSIIVGFAVIPHALKRILLVVPGAWNYFADHDTLVAEDRVVSALGQGITNRCLSARNRNDCTVPRTMGNLV